METFTPYKRWLNQHDEDIRREFPDKPTEELAGDIDVNYYTVSRRATRIGVGKSEAFMHTSWKKGATKKGGRKKRNERTKNSESADQYMQEHFTGTKNEELAKHFGVDVKTVRRWARRLGLVKSEAFMKAVRGSGRRGKPFYTPEQIAWRNQCIAEVYPDGDDDALRRLSDELGIGIAMIRRIANDIGVRRIHRPPQYLDELAEFFPTHTDRECAEKFGVSKPIIHNIARKYGWKKSEKHIRKIHLSNVAAAQKSKRKRGAG